MKYLLALFMGLGALSVASCTSTPTADVMSSKTVTIDVTGMT